MVGGSELLVEDPRVGRRPVGGALDRAATTGQRTGEESACPQPGLAVRWRERRRPGRTGRPPGTGSSTGRRPSQHVSSTNHRSPGLVPAGPGRVDQQRSEPRHPPSLTGDPSTPARRTKQCRPDRSQMSDTWILHSSRGQPTPERRHPDEPASKKSCEALPAFLDPADFARVQTSSEVLAHGDKFRGIGVSRVLGGESYVVDDRCWSR